MRSKTAKLLIDHALTLATGVLLGVSLTVPVMSTDFVSAVSAVGSLLAGGGTVGLLLFGWLKADEWMNKMDFEKRDKILQSISEAIYDLNVIKEMCGYHSTALKHRAYLTENLEAFNDEVYEEDPATGEVKKASDHQDENIDDYSRALDRRNAELSHFDWSVDERLKSFQSNIIQANVHLVTLNDLDGSLDVGVFSTTSDIKGEVVGNGDTVLLERYIDQLKDKISALSQYGV